MKFSRLSIPRKKNRAILALFVLVSFAFAPRISFVAEISSSKDTAPEAQLPPAELDEESLAMGQALFRGLCSGCHGGAGRGGKGPNLTDDRWLHGGTDAEIIHTIQNGVPGTTMKKLGESLEDHQIQKLLAYIRSLALAGGDDDWEPYFLGDAKQGEELFFDKEAKAQCFSCHTIARRGGRIGPPLDRIAARRSARYIMESIAQPSKDIDPKYEVVIVATNQGQVITGIRMNETNFSIQLREQNGRFHSLQKRDLEDVHVSDVSMMPNSLTSDLTVKQLHDLFAFLMTLE